MRAAQIKQYGHADAIQLARAPKPKAGRGQVVLEVFASSINPVDAKLREGKLQSAAPLGLPITLGVDVAGIVDSVGEEVLDFKAGDRVYGMASPLSGGSGAFAEFAVAPAQMLGKMPQRSSYTEAAAIALTGVSALQALTHHLDLKAGQRILIQGGAGGIGSIAIQIAKFLDAFVATTVATEDVEFARSLGADQIIDFKKHQFEDLVSELDAVLDTAGGEIAQRSYQVLRPAGRLVSMTAPPDELLAQRHDVTAMMQLTEVTTRRLNALAKLIDDGVVTVHIEKTYPLSQVREAFAEKESGHVRGKIAIEVRRQS
ncbi:MAG: NADPH:quinone reductase Zn-dependent oxidoreductase [Myxococcaceae bacterium]|nr:NADPH:quinone reductase Zn-dependent oxidoreductase [Myxococcaceae bacterium]